MTLIKRNGGMFPSLWNDLFENDWFGMPNVAQAGTRIPAVNIKDTADSYQIEMAAPGMKKKDFLVNLDNGMLTISSEQESDSSAEHGNYTRQEFNYRSFERVFTLPDSTASEKITASYIDGVLRISIPKKEEAKPKPLKTIKIS